MCVSLVLNLFFQPSIQSTWWLKLLCSSAFSIASSLVSWFLEKKSHPNSEGLLKLYRWIFHMFHVKTYLSFSWIVIVILWQGENDVIDCIDIYRQPAFDHPLLKEHKIQVIISKNLVWKNDGITATCSVCLLLASAMVARKYYCLASWSYFLLKKSIRWCIHKTSDRNLIMHLKNHS